MLKLRGALIVAVFALTAVGCANYTTPLVPRRRMSPAERNFNAVWQASRTVLRKYYFTLDREDRRAGIITTEPLTGKVFGEFWRRDAAGPDNLAESSIQTIFRQAKVTIRPLASNKEDFKAVVEVRTFRSDRRESQVTSTSEALDLFRLPGGSNRTRTLLEYDKGQAAEGAVPLGRDKALERRIASDIMAARLTAVR